MEDELGVRRGGCRCVRLCQKKGQDRGRIGGRGRPTLCCERGGRGWEDGPSNSESSFASEDSDIQHLQFVPQATTQTRLFCHPIPARHPAATSESAPTRSAKSWATSASSTLTGNHPELTCTIFATTTESTICLPYYSPSSPPGTTSLTIPVTTYHHYSVLSDHLHPPTLSLVIPFFSCCFGSLLLHLGVLPWPCGIRERRVPSGVGAWPCM